MSILVSFWFLVSGFGFSLAATTTGGQLTITTTEAAIFDPNQDGFRGCTLLVRNTGSVYAFVHVPGMHKSGQGVPIPGGEKEYIRVGINDLPQVTAWCASGTCTIDVAVVARLDH